MNPQVRNGFSLIVPPYPNLLPKGERTEEREIYKVFLPR